jgi:hypothetical protein
MVKFDEDDADYQVIAANLSAICKDLWPVHYALDASSHTQKSSKILPQFVDPYNDDTVDECCQSLKS